MTENTCENCKNRDEFGFCYKLVVDTRRQRIAGSQITAYYIDENQGEELECSNSFIVPDWFSCNMHSELSDINTPN